MKNQVQVVKWSGDDQDPRSTSSRATRFLLEQGRTYTPSMSFSERINLDVPVTSNKYEHSHSIPLHKYSNPVQSSGKLITKRYIDLARIIPMQTLPEQPPHPPPSAQPPRRPRSPPTRATRTGIARTRWVMRLAGWLRRSMLIPGWWNGGWMRWWRRWWRWGMRLWGDLFFFFIVERKK